MSRRGVIGGGIIGWAIGGPIGALLGAALGRAIGDLFSGENRSGNNAPHVTTERDFHASLLILASMVMKADGQVDQRELNHVREQFKKWFGAEKANASFKVFKQLANERPQITSICAQIRRHMAIQGRIQIINFLFELATVDGGLKTSERDQIARIARYLGLGQADFMRIYAMHSKVQKEDPYKVLGLSPNVTDAELKSAYRRLVKKYHPDAVVGMGDDVVEGAESMFRKLQSAYESVCERRGIK